MRGDPSVSRMRRLGRLPAVNLGGLAACHIEDFMRELADKKAEEEEQKRG